MPRIVVLGCGVSGLTSALLLSRDSSNSITIIAKHMPGDYDIGYASPWAGANFMPFGAPGSRSGELEGRTWPELARLAAELPEAGVHFQEVRIYARKKDEGTPTFEWEKHLVNPDPWYKTVVPDFGHLQPSQLPPGIDRGQKFTSVCINTALYLPWLASQCLRNGVVIRRGGVEHVADAACLHHSGSPAEVVVNCTGLGARTLGGVQDQDVVPARGQIVVVRNDPQGVMVGTSGTDDGADEACYVMNRAAGGGCVLGGSYQQGSWESQPDLNLATRIMKRCVDICPALTGGRGIEALSIVRHGVGLRPVRKPGVRLEGEQRLDGEQRLLVVHNYGHGGAGYQMSYGAAREVVDIVGREMQKKSSRL